MTSWTPNSWSHSLSTASRTVTTFVSHVLWGEKEGPQDLDTLQVLLQLCILAYKPIGTELVVRNHQICLLEPQNKPWWHHDTSFHVSYLRKPLERAQNEMNPAEEPRLRRIFTTALLGLDRLKQTYPAEIVGDAIDQYKRPLEQALQGIGSPKECVVSYPNGWTPRLVHILDLCLEEAEERRDNPDESEAIAQAISHILRKKASDEPVSQEQVEKIVGKPLKLTICESNFLSSQVQQHSPAPPQSPVAAPLNTWRHSERYDQVLRETKKANASPPPMTESKEGWEDIPLRHPRPDNAFPHPNSPITPPNVPPIYALLAQCSQETGFASQDPDCHPT